MKKQKYLRSVGGPSMVALGLALLASGPADAQRTIPGYTRSDQSDVTGPSVTSGDQLAALFTEPGTVLSMYCPVAWGVRNAADEIQMRLTSANLQPALGIGRRTISSGAQLAVLTLLMADPDDDDADEAVLGALVAGNSRGAQPRARRLVNELRGLFHVVEDMDPAHPGEAAATRMARAIGAYNGFVDASDVTFLVTPPGEMAAIHSTLNHLVIATLENEDRPAETEIVDAAGLACAIIVPPAPAPAPPPPPPPVEQAISICILVDNQFRDIAAVRRPEQGDTMVIVAGVRRPIYEVYPTARNVPSPPWVPLGEPVTIGTTQYQPFGVSRTVSPNEVALKGEVQGFDYYAAPGDPATPAVIYFPVGPSCEVQPYRSVETIRVRG